MRRFFEMLLNNLGRFTNWLDATPHRTAASYLALFAVMAIFRENFTLLGVTGIALVLLQFLRLRLDQIELAFEEEFENLWTGLAMEWSTDDLPVDEDIEPVIIDEDEHLIA